MKLSKHFDIDTNMFLILTIIVVGFLTTFTIVTAAVDSSGSTDNNIFVRIQDDNLNDTILEFFHNCKCVAYYQCEEINQYIIAGRAGYLNSTPIECSDTNYHCCKKAPEKPPTSTSNNNTTPSTTTTSTTTKKPSIDDVHSRDVLSASESCGIPRTGLTVRILNPETDSATTISGEHPWIVEIFQKRGKKNAYRFRCAGTLIHPRVVLTALHCVKSSKEDGLKVVATGKDVFQNLGANADNERDVLNIIKHPEYYSGGLYNDIALIVLKTDFEYANYSINSICLPDADQVLDGKRCLAVGWGENSDHASIPLRKVDVPIVNSSDCQNLLRKTRLGSDFKLHESFLCAGGEEGKDTCKGDGGGPLICLGDNYNYFQAGIVSWGVNCGVINEPGLYTNVALFREWIVQELRKNDVDI